MTYSSQSNDTSILEYAINLKSINYFSNDYFGNNVFYYAKKYKNKNVINILNTIQ
jgi:hypothetical protein